MSWPEIETAKKDNRHEIILSGIGISKRISDDGLDPSIFDLSNLNYLNIHETILDDVPDDIQKLQNLQSLVLHTNRIAKINPLIGSLTKLKLLDLFHNELKSLPEDISKLVNLVTLNLSHNQLEELPSLSKNTKLSVLNLSNNKLKEFPDVFSAETSNLSELFLSHNEIELIPSKIGKLVSLKLLHLNNNKLKTIPGELYDCNKLKEIDLKDNPIVDKRLLKLIVQCRPKQVLDYVKQHCPRETAVQTKAPKAGGGKKNLPLENNIAEHKEPTLKITVHHLTNDSLKIIVKENVKDVRPHLVACLVLNVNFTEENFKKFIQLQTKLHDTVCDKRNAATIATHDFKKLSAGDVVYTALPPNELVVKPLNRTVSMTGAELFSKLRTEADNLRKEKKKNTFSGIHKYLYLLEGKSKYPCLLSASQEVISFPPITNSDITKVSLDTQSLLIEVTSAVSQGICKKVANVLIKEMVPLFGNSLELQQVKNVDIEGNLKSVFPSRNDLIFENCTEILVERE